MRFINPIHVARPRMITSRSRPPTCSDARPSIRRFLTKIAGVACSRDDRAAGGETGSSLSPHEQGTIVIRRRCMERAFRLHHGMPPSHPKLRADDARRGGSDDCRRHRRSSQATMSRLPRHALSQQRRIMRSAPGTAFNLPLRSPGTAPYAGSAVDTQRLSR